MSDLRQIVFKTLGLFFGLVIFWISLLFVSSCGFDSTCYKSQTHPERTPIPTLYPATLPAPKMGSADGGVKCQVSATDLIGAWVDAGYPEKDVFNFVDIKGQNCTATFGADVQKLFKEANYWYSGALACSGCHNADVLTAQANMDLSSYQGMLMGSRRTDGGQGNDIFGGGTWETSKLYEMLVIKKLMPFGRPETVPAEGPIIFAGSPVVATVP